jgi:hypothetical protein
MPLIVFRSMIRHSHGFVICIKSGDAFFFHTLAWVYL